MLKIIKQKKIKPIINVQSQSTKQDKTKSKSKKVRIKKDKKEESTKRRWNLKGLKGCRFVRRLWRVICSLYIKFCSETTIHGMKHTVQNSHHFIERILWLVLVCAAFYGACICGISQLSRYNEEPLVVSMKRDYRRWWSSFPAVTACVINRMDEDSAQELIERHWNVTFEQEPEKYQYYRSLVELVSDVSFRSNIQSFWKYQNDPSVAGISLLDIATTVHPQFKVKVTAPNGLYADWVPVITEMGLCKSFNSAYAKYQHVSDTPLEPALLFKCHYNSLQCFVKIESINEPVRFFIHSPYDIPDAVSNPVGALEPGTEAVLDFTLLEMQAGPAVQALKLDQRKCRYPEEIISDKIQAYSYGLCQMHCRSKMALMFCGCRPFFHIQGEGSVCDAHGMACIGRNAEILINLPKNLARCSCLPQCTELNYYSHSTKLVGIIGMLVTILTALYNGLCYACWFMGVLHAVLPGWIEAAGALTAVYYASRLRQPSPDDVNALFGGARCIAHRGAGLDAPENTIAAFKYCAQRSCDFVEFDVRTCAGGQLVLLHDADTRRLTGEPGPDVVSTAWSDLSALDIAAAHPNRENFGTTHLCKLNEALDFLLENDMRMVIDVKGEDKGVINGVVDAFASRPQLYSRAAVTAFNPLVLYQIRWRDPRIVGAVSYRPYAISHHSYDAQNGPTQPRFADGSAMQIAARAADVLHSALWRASARWCRVSAVLLHKDIVSPCEVAYWKSQGVHTIGWSVNRPLEKLYWRGVLGATYLANTLLGEPPQDKASSESLGVSGYSSDDVRAPNGRRAVEELLKEKSK